MVILYKDSLVRGFNKGLKTTWELAKMVVPIYFLVTFLKYTPILNWISNFFAPAMGILGLPGEASLPLVLGNMINLYAGIGAIVSLDLTQKQISILAIMLSFSHSLLIESAVAKKTGIKVSLVITIRILLAIIFGMLFNIIL